MTNTTTVSRSFSTVNATHAVIAAEPTYFVHRGPRVLLRLEGFAILIAAASCYRWMGGSWGLFAALFLLPDLSMLGYFAGARIGAVSYNAGHSLLGPLVLGGFALLSGASSLSLYALIWVAHIGFDRAAGYGLKHGTGFGHTHLGNVGRNGLGTQGSNGAGREITASSPARHAPSR